MRREFTAWGFLGRWLGAAVLVLGTYNPTGWSFAHWALQDGEDLPLKVLVGLGLAILYAIYLRATWNAIGIAGTALIVAFLGALAWTCVYYGILDLTEPGTLTWLVLFVAATVMGIGLSWSHVNRRLSGQADVDDVET